MEQNKVQITVPCARALLALADNISTIDTRAGCSDAFFRKHFMLLANTARDTGALRELQGAVEDAMRPEPPGEPTPEKEPVKVEGEPVAPEAEPAASVSETAQKPARQTKAQS